MYSSTIPSFYKSQNHSNILNVSKKFHLCGWFFQLITLVFLDLDDKKPVVEYTAKITLPNGEIIEKTVSTAGTFPSLEDFDLSTREGFLQDFDLLEKTVLETSRKLNGELSREYLDASSKKNKSNINFLGIGIRTDFHSCIWRAC